MKMRFFPVAVLAAACFLMLGGAAPAPDMSPPKLAGPGWQKYSSNNDFTVYSQDAEGGISKVLMVGVMEGVAPEDCFKIVTNYDNFPKTMPYIRFAHLIHTDVKDANLTQHYAFFYVDAPLVSPRYYTLRLDDQTNAGGEKGAYMSDWHLVTDGPYHETPQSPDIAALSQGKLGAGVETSSNQGFWLFEPLPDGSGTKVSYMVLTNPGGSIPHWIANKANTVALPKLWNALTAAVHD